MSGVARLRTFFGGESSPRQPEHGQWGEPSGKPRILIENPDRAELWAHEEILREAGYEVATCVGPTAGDATTGDPHSSCPLLTEGQCHLVSAADVVVSTTSLGSGPEILAKLSARLAPRLVVEGTTADLARNADAIAGATEIAQPVTPQTLLASVEHALADRAAARA